MPDATATLNPQIAKAEQYIREAQAKNKNIASTAQEIDLASATLNDELFIGAQTQVSRLKRVNQIRRAAGKNELDSLPKELESPGFIANLKQEFPEFLDKVVQTGQSGVENTSIGLARAIYQGKEPTQPPDGAGFRIISNIISLFDPVTVLGGGIGGQAGKQVIKQVGKKLVGKALARGTAVGTTLATLTAVRDPLAQQAITGEIDPLQTIEQTLKSGALGLAAGAAGAVPIVGLPLEIGTFATGGASLEGRLPTQDDFIESAGVILGLRLQGAITSRIGKAVFRKSRGETPTAEEQDVLDQMPKDTMDKILAEASKGRVQDLTLDKKALLTPEGAASFVERHPMQAKTVVGATEATRVEFSRIKDVVPNAEIQKWNKADRQKFQALVVEASGKEVVKPLPTKEIPDGTQEQVRTETEKGREQAKAETQVKAKEEVGVPVEDLPTTGKQLTKVQETIVENAQKSATPETPPEQVPVVPLNAVVDAKRRGLSPFRNFTNYLQRGGQHEDFVESNRIKDREISKSIRQVQFGIQAYDLAARKTYGLLGRIPAEDLAQMNAYLTENAPLDSVPEGMRGAVMRLRTEMDALSQRAIDEGVVQGEMKAIFTENKGTYMNRSYRIFDEPNFYKTAIGNKKVPTELRNKAKAVFRGELVAMLGREPTDAESDAYIRSFLYESAKEGGMLDAIAKGRSGNPGNLSILKEKNVNLPEEIKTMFGERTDPRANYANSLVKLGKLIANHQSLARIREQGLGEWLFEEPTGEFIAKIDDGTADVLYPLSQGKPIYTTPGYEQAMRNAYSTTDNFYLRMYYKANAITKWNKTAGSVMGIMRNFMGNPMIALANGHFRFWKIPKAIQTTGTDVVPSVFNFLKLSNKAQQAEVLKLIDYGVMHDASRSGELRQIVKDASRSDSAEAFSENMIVRLGKLPFKKMSEMFRAGDDFWHAYGYYNELADLQAAYKGSGKTAEWLELRAASKVRRTYPTYSKAPFIIQQARKAIVVGDFVTFPAEMIRSTGAVPPLIAEELKIPEEQAIGAKRAFGFLAMATSVAAIGATSRMMTGVTKKEEEALRVLGPEWMANSTLLHLGKSDRLKYRVIDTTYSIPQGFMTAPIIAALRGEDTFGLEEGVLREAFRPFFNETILYGTIRDVLANKQISRESAATIRNKEDDWDKQALDITNYFVRKLDPGTVDTMVKIHKGITNQPLKSGTIPDAKTEIIAASTGQRIWTYDVPRDLGFKARNLTNRRRDARKIFNSAAYAPNSTPEEISDSYDRSVEADRALFGNLQGIIQKAKILGMDDDEVRMVLANRRSPIAKGEIDDLIGGVYDNENLLRDIVWSLTGKTFDEQLPKVLRALGVSQSEAKQLYFDEIRHRGHTTISALKVARLRRRMAEDTP